MDTDLTGALTVDRLQFAFTVTFHYLFPQLTMGLAFMIALFGTLGYWRDRGGRGAQPQDVTLGDGAPMQSGALGGPHPYKRAAHFWTVIFAITFAFGVATGVPMEFQFGTNWANFSHFAGGCIGQTLALEGVFAFFLESSFLGVMLAGEKRVGARLYWAAALIVFFGAWLSAYFILATNAWMQHPVGYRIAPDGTVQLDSFLRLIGNPWLLWQFTHNQCAAVVTGSFVVAGAGAYYVLAGRHLQQGRLYLRVGLFIAVIASFLMLFPTGHGEAHQVWRYQPVKGAAMEGLFHTEQPAPITIIGQPNMQTLTIDNPIRFPALLSFLTYWNFAAEVRGLTAHPRDEWPDLVPLVYYAYHIMVILGTLFIVITLGAVFLLWRGRLWTSRWMLWIVMLATPFPYIATTAGWITTEVGRQPWLVHGLYPTAAGLSPMVSSGNGLFTLIGFLGLYLLIGIAYIVLVLGLLGRGPGLGLETPEYAQAPFTPAGEDNRSHLESELHS